MENLKHTEQHHEPSTHPSFGLNKRSTHVQSVSSPSSPMGFIFTFTSLIHGYLFWHKEKNVDSAHCFLDVSQLSH